nr:CoA ester lyase [uncultured Sphingomonas sp.]
MSASLFDRPAVLFLPASNARAIAKAKASDADLVILDLEDAVRGEEKDTARDAAVEAVADKWPMPVAIRVNGMGTDHYGADVAAIMKSACQLIVLPNVREAGDIAALRHLVSRPVAAMVETVHAILDAPAIARLAAMMIVGTNDLRAEIGIETGGGRLPIMTALQTTVLAARAAGVPVIDGVYNRLDDEEGFIAEAREGRSLGFDGKSLIHPAQIRPCHAAWAPTLEQIARAERLVDAATGGAERFEGEMIESMHIDAARRLLERTKR